MRRKIKPEFDHFTENINMTIVANVVSVNYTWFSEKFKEHTGVNFNDYLKRMRIEEAKRLLEIVEQAEAEDRKVIVFSFFLDNTLYT